MINKEGYNYEELKPEDKAFVDGYMLAIKDACENALVEDDFIIHDLPEDSALNKAIMDAISLFQAKTKDYMESCISDLIIGTLDSYGDK